MYRYLLHIECNHGGSGGVAPLATQDLAPIVEDARFTALRQGLIEDGAAAYSVRPVLVNPNPGQDSEVLIVAGFEVRVTGEDGYPGYRKLYGVGDFQQLALEKFRKVTRCDSGKGSCVDVQYWIEAKPTLGGAGEGNIGGAGEHELVLNRLDFTCGDFPLPTFRLRVKEPVFGALFVSTLQEPYPLFMPKGLLQHMRDLSADLTREMAGFLVGEVYRHPITSEVFGVIQDSIVAQTNQATTTSIRMDGQTWQAFYEEKKIRCPSSRLMGWWHSHPCEAKEVRAAYGRAEGKAEGRAAQPGCSAGPIGTGGERISTLFLSEQDLFIHRRFFSAPYCVCMVVDPRAAPGEDIAIWGWQDGLATLRNAYVL